MPSTTNLGQLFREARRRDWAVVWVSHAWAVVLTIIVLIGMCAPEGNNPSAVTFPHLVYWTMTAGTALDSPWPWAWLFLLGMPLFPIWLYRGISYYRHAGTWTLLAAGLRGRWAGQRWLLRALAALRNAVLPTWLLVWAGAPTLAFEVVDPPLRRPGRTAPRVLLALAISLHHWPFAYAIRATLDVSPPWVMRLPSWAGPCEFELGNRRHSVQGSWCAEPLKTAAAR